MSDKCKFKSLKKQEEFLNRIFSFLTEKEKILVIADVSKLMRNNIFSSYKKDKISIDAKSITNCLKEVKGVVKSMTEFKFICSNHSETLEDSLKKFIEAHKYFAFYRSMISLPTLIFNNLQVLDFSHFNMGCDGIMLITPLLKTSKTLSTINLGYNNIGDDGCAFLKLGLEKNTSLTSIILECNGISSDGLTYLLDPLIKHKTLKSLKMCLNLISIEGLKLFSSKLELKDPAFQVLDFKYNNIAIKDENVDLFKKYKIMY